MRIVADEEIPYLSEFFSSYGDLILKPGRLISADDVCAADILLVRSVTRVNATLLHHSSVKFVGSVTAGADHLDTEWLDEAGIAWSIAQGFNAPPVCDYIVSVIALLQKQKKLHKDNLKAAIIGVGNVGKLVAKALRDLNIETILCDPLRAKTEKDFPDVSLQDIRDVDLITLHVPLTVLGSYSTYHFLDNQFLSRQQQGTVLINASRGSVIETNELLKHAKNFRLCLDVFENEPIINKELLAKALIATPHIAGYSKQSKIRGIEMIYRVACEKKIIKTLPIPPIDMPKQELVFSDKILYWQDIVLGIFNPQMITTMMQTVLLPTGNEAELFDKMRKQFNYRSEFAFTTIKAATLRSEDEAILRKLNININ